MSPYDLYTKEELENLNNKLNDTKNKTIKKEWKRMLPDNFDFRKMVKKLGVNQIDEHEKKINKKAKEHSIAFGNKDEAIRNEVEDILRDKDEWLNS